MGMIGGLVFRTMPLRYFAATAFAEWTVAVGVLCGISLYNEKIQVEERARSIARTLYYKNARSTMLVGSLRIPAESGDLITGMSVSNRASDDSAAFARHRLLLQAAATEEPSTSPASTAPLPIRTKIISLDTSQRWFSFDQWEAGALASLAGSNLEHSEILDDENGTMLRFVGALRDAKNCTPCHARKDFQPGKLRGAMSITIPLTPIWAEESNHRSFTLMLLGSLWIIGMGGISLMHRGLTQRIRERDEAREESRRIALEKSNAERALAASTEQLLQAQQRLQAEKLRTEIAGNLHDDIGTMLSSTSIFSELLSKELTSSASPRALKLLSRIKYNLLAAQLNMHDIVWAINPENDSLDAMLFKLQDYASDILESNGIAFRCSIAPVEKQRTVPMNIRKELLLIFKEAFNNIVRHAQAHEVTLAISYTEPILHLSIGDDGKGIEQKPNSEGNGLKNMRTRAEKLSGAVRIESHAARGTLVQIDMPLA